MGPLVNVLVLRADLGGSPSFRELLRRTREGTLDAYAYQDLPFEKLVEELQPERHLSRNPLFQVMFVHQNVPTTPTTSVAPSASSDAPPLVVGTAKFDLTLSTVEMAQGLAGTWEYNTDLFDAATIARLAGHFHTLLTGIVAQPDQRLCDLPLLSPAERAQVLHEWNATERCESRERRDGRALGKSAVLQLWHWRGCPQC